jgi:exodeoxyribonuclease VII small subunit
MTKAVETIDKLTFETALTELDGIVRALEGGQTSLEDSIKAYERGMQLKDLCETRLKDARLRVEKINLGADGKPSGTSPFNPDQ